MFSLHASPRIIAHCLHFISYRNKTFIISLLLALLGILHYLARLTIAAGSEYEYDGEQNETLQCNHLHHHCDNHETNQSVIESEHLLNGSIGSQPRSRCVRNLLSDANGYLTADDARSRRQNTAVLHLAVSTPVRAPI